MKVLIVSPWGERLGGAEVKLWTFLRHVDRSRLEPVVAFLADGPFRVEVERLAIPAAVVATGRLRYGGRPIRTLRRLRRLLASERPDLILNWGAKPQIVTAPAVASARQRDRVVWWQTEIPGHPVHRLATALPARAIGCSSQYVAAAQGRVRPRRATFVVHPGVDEPAPVKSEEVARLRRELALPDERTVVGTVGRLAPVKRQHHLLRALAEARRQGHDVHALIVGGDAHGFAPGYGRFLREATRALGLGEAVSFTGQVGDVTPYLELMDVFASCAPDEGFGIAIVEAMASGLPVIAVDAGGPREIVEPGLTGLLVDATDQDPLARAIADLSADPELRRRLGAAARERFAERFTASRMARELEQRLQGSVADR
jgi:glycosyltransferase involved in cell wall biosynthesis